MAINVTFIQGACASVVELGSLTREHFLSFLEITEEELSNAKDMDEATDITLDRLSTNDIVTVFNSDGEASFFICPKNSASIEKDDE